MKKNITATNAIEAKVITDKYLKQLTPKRCVKLFKDGQSDLRVLTSEIAYKIGASAFYYGAECKVFCSEVIHRHIINCVIEYTKPTN